MAMSGAAFSQEPPKSEALDVRDPVTQDAVDLLDNSGLIARQSRLGEGILILERQLRHAEAVEDLIMVLGPDAEIEISPGVFKSFADAPAGIRAKIELNKLNEQLVVVPKVVLPVVATPEPLLPARSDGTEVMPFIVDNHDGELDLNPTVTPDATDFTISLREIFGTFGSFIAVLQVGNERVQVRPGDELPGDIKILTVDETGVSLPRSGEAINLSIPG